MRKKISKIILAIVIIVAIILLVFPNIPNDISLIFLSGPPSPKSDVPITYTLGWWNNQNDLIVTGLETSIIQSKLSLFNNKSLVRYKISGKLFHQNGRWKPYISEVHLSEKYNLYDFNLRKYEGEITAIPIIKLQDDDSYSGDTLNFKINIEEIIESAGWGKCVYLIKCSNITDTLIIHQYK